MSWHRVLAGLSTLMLALLGLTATAAAAPALSPRSPFAGSQVAAVPSAVVTAQARAALLAQMTGLKPSQVRTRDACSAPAPGHVGCDAHVLVLRSTGAPVRPRVRGRGARAQVVPAMGTPVGVTPATSTGQAPPSPGTPAWLQQAYDLSALSATGGVGDTVAVIDAYDDPTAEQDLGTFRSQYGLPACTTANGCFQQVNQTGQTSPLPSPGGGWETEASLDLDAVSSLCPNCHIILVEANSAATPDLLAAMQAGAALGANQLSDSWGSVGPRAPSGTFTFPGVATIASTGDGGVDPAGQDQYPAALAGVTAAGGTSLAPATSGPRGFAESAWSNVGSGCDQSEAKPSYQTDPGCAGRAYADVSADADPNTGLEVYSSPDGGWTLVGGTSLSAPLIAAYEAVTGVTGATPQWAYADSSLLNDPVTGSNGSCDILYICSAGTGYDGPTGAGSISGQVVAGPPGIGGPTVTAGDGSLGYAEQVNTTSAVLAGGVYPNGYATSYHWEYGADTSYGQQTAVTEIGSAAAAVPVTDTLTGLTPGTTYHYRLVATSSAGAAYGYDYTFTTPATDAPPVDVAASPPTIAGTTTQGQTLTASTGQWSPSGTPSFQWQRSTDGGTTWSDICGATGSDYTLTAADVGAEISVTVTETDAAGATGAAATAVGPIASGAPTAVTPPRIAGPPSVGHVLTAQPGEWTTTGELTYAYQWQRSTDGGTTWTAIPGATAGTYTPTTTDVSDELDVVVSATDGDGTTPASSPAVGPVSSGAPVLVSAPGISGSATRGDTLTAGHGQWSPAATSYQYQWQSSADGGSTWIDITDATGSSYVPDVADEGTDLRAVVGAGNADGTTFMPTAAVGPVMPSPPVDVTPPSVSGGPQEGQNLTASPGVWTSPGTISYQWQRDPGTGWQGIPGATAATYQVSPADAGGEVRVLVTEVNVDGSVTAPSAAAAIPLPPPAILTAPTPGPGAGVGSGTGSGSGVGTPPAGPVIVRLPVLTGSARVGATIRLSGGVYRNGAASAAIERCTRVCVTVSHSNAYRLTSADAGAFLRARVTVAGPGGSVNAWATRIVGPVRSASAGAATLRIGRRTTVRDGAGRPLLSVLGGGAEARVSTVRRVTRATLWVTPLRRVAGGLRVWICVVRRTGAASCTASRRLNARAGLPVTVTVGGRIDVIAVAGR